jgi:hypothetical protein
MPVPATRPPVGSQPGDEPVARARAPVPEIRAPAEETEV